MWPLVILGAGLWYLAKSDTPTRSPATSAEEAGAKPVREQLRAAVRLVPPVDYVGAGAERVVRLDSRR